MLPAALLNKPNTRYYYCITGKVHHFFVNLHKHIHKKIIYHVMKVLKISLQQNHQENIMAAYPNPHKIIQI